LNRFGRIGLPTSDRQRDIRTEQTDKQTSCDSIVRAMHLRGKNQSIGEVMHKMMTQRVQADTD